MSTRSALREHWRVILLAIFIVASLGALFVPQGAGASSTTNLAQNAGPTNLKYGIDLSGGTRIRAPIAGVTAENVNVTSSDQQALRQTVANSLNTSVSNVNPQPATRTVEVYGENVDKAALRSVLQKQGVWTSQSTVRPGVTQQTRDVLVSVLKSKISAAGFAGGTVQTVTNSTGTHFVVVEMPNANRTEVQHLISRRGVVELVASYPDSNGTGQRNVTVATQGSFSYIGPANPAQGPQQPNPYVPVTLKDQAAQNFQQEMNDKGFTTTGVGQCNAPAGQQYCLNTVVDGKVVYSANMGSSLAPTLKNGQFTNDPSFVMTTTNMSQARSLQIDLRAGALPAPLALDKGTSYYLSPGLAGRFKFDSFIAGLFAVFAVSGVVFLRYGEPKVALPMIVTALSEVLIMLGFAAAIQLPLNLSHIAGFIAVIGTGVDDLVIIADEVMSEGGVSSARVFQSRFRKAFWVIGAAAATTIVAMSPLAYLSLGDLRGFAIITILGVLIGVLVTRPAYGDILRLLKTGER